jgi:hypothetical protein
VSDGASIGEAAVVAPTPPSSQDTPPLAATFLKGFVAAILVGAVIYAGHRGLSDLEERNAKR